MTIQVHLYKTWVIGIVSLTVLVGSCTKSGDDATPASTDVSSFQLIQQKILTPSCATAGCHASEQDAAFKQHGLVLAEAVAYKNLVGVAPTNTDAKTDGLFRVKPFASAQSLLFHKLNFDASHHTGKQYGNPMPLGKEALYAGQIEFIRRWIEAGAPKEGDVVDAKLLDDKTPSYVVTPFEPLTAPTSGLGFQMSLPLFNVAPNFERELFMRRNVGNPADAYVSRIQIKMRPNSHHFIAYAFSNNTLPALDQVRDLRNPDGTANLLTFLSMQNHIFLAGSQTSTYDYTFPDGTALLLPANTSLDLNTHYVNKTSAPIPGEVSMNLYTIDKAKVKNVVQTLNLANQSFTLQPNTRVTLTKTFTFSKARIILALTSHTHKLGEKFVIKIKGGVRDGEVVYTATDWEHPDIVTYKVPISLKAGEGLTSEITYNNTTGKAVSFGLTSEDEMGIIFGYYYE